MLTKQSAAAVRFAFCGALVVAGLWDKARADEAPPAAAVVPAVDDKPAAPADLANLLDVMAKQLEDKPNFVVLQLESLSITQGDVAEIVRAMPPAITMLGFAEVYRRALDVTIRQKAMVLRARLEHLDQDPKVIHLAALANERVLADAWLRHQADAAITDKALRERYDRDIAGKPAAPLVRARVILLPTEAEATLVIQQLRDGANFGTLARDLSKDPTAPKEGDLGYLPRDALQPDVAAAAFSLSPGEVSSYPIPSRLGFFVIKVEGRTTRDTPSFDEARGGLEKALRADATRKAVESLLDNIKFVAPTKAGQAAAGQGVIPAKP